MEPDRPLPLRPWPAPVMGAVDALVPSSIRWALLLFYSFPSSRFYALIRAFPVLSRDSNVFFPPSHLSPPFPPSAHNHLVPEYLLHFMAPSVPFSLPQHALVLILLPSSRAELLYIPFILHLKLTVWLVVRFRKIKFHHKEHTVSRLVMDRLYLLHLWFFTGEHFPNDSPFCNNIYSKF